MGRLSLLIAAVVVVAGSMSPAAAVDPVPTAVVHVPPLAFADQPIEISAQVHCMDGAGACPVVLGYRRPEGVITGSGVFTEVLMAADPDLPPVADVEVFRAEIPASAVTTAGIDYYIRATDSAGVARWPPGVGALQFGSEPVSYRADVLVASTIVHTPPPPAVVGKPLRLTFSAPCTSTRDCEPTVWYRSTPVADTLTPRPLLPGEPDWDAAPVQRIRVQGDDADVVAFEAEIPAVDARGVDYLIRVADGTTANYWPGTPYEAWVGQSVALVAYHVPAITPPVITHAPVPTALTESAHELSWTVTCAAPRVSDCDTAAFWRHGTTDDVIQPPADFTELPTTVELLAHHDNAWLLKATATMQTGAVPGELEQYYLWATDGEANVYLPGTTYQGVVPLDGFSAAGLAPFSVILVGADPGALP